MEKTHAGLFITFEGGEGAGKTTLIEKVFHTLSATRSVLKTRAPGGTQVGNAIRQLLLSGKGLDTRCELFLFLADRAQHVQEVILPALKADQIVLCDRFNDSTLAYQGGARGFEPSWLHKLLAFSCYDVQPDLTLYLDLDPAIGFQRVHAAKGKKDRIESESLNFHHLIRTAFHEIARKEPVRFHRINAEQSPDEVFTHSMDKIHALLASHRK